MPLKTIFIDAPLSIVNIKQRSLLYMLIYFSLGLVIFGSLTWLMLSNQEQIKSALLNYIFPQSWHEISEKLAHYLFESQAKTVIANMIISGSMVIASIFLFPFKELFSAQFEKDGDYNNGEVKEFPLGLQALEEVKLFLFYLTAQLTILWIGYYPYAWTHWLSIGLSYLFLFFTFGVDFISPTFQRHRQRYSLILKFLFKKYLSVILFGFLYSLPIILLSHFIFSFEQLTLIEIASILFLVNLFLLTLAIPAGTHIASRLMPQLRLAKAPQKRSVQLSYSLMAAILICALILHTKLIKSMHHKSQLLKAEYSIDWDSIDYQLPSFSEFFNGKALTNLSFDLAIKNPTQFDIDVEPSQIVILKDQLLIATIDLNGFRVESGKTHAVTMTFDSNSDLSKITNFRTLLENWRVDMQLDLMPGIPFIFNLIEQKDEQ
jgi:hypothetical protein